MWTLKRPLKPGPRGLLRRGSVLILMTLSLFLLFGCISLVVDLGFAFFKRQQAQAAADASASAAAAYAFNNGYTCGSGGVVCNTTYNCAYPAITPPNTPLEAGCLYASTNGFVNTGTQTVSLIQNNTAPPGVSGNAPSLWIEADVSQSLATMFGVFAQVNSLAIKAKSVAAVSSIGTTNCVMGLSASGTAVT